MNIKRTDREIRTASVRLERKNVQETGQFEGYGSVFGVKDSYDEVVARGAFAESLKAHKEAGTMPALLWQHRADTPIGVYTEMYEDEKGLYVKGALALGTQKGKEAHELLLSGALNGLSIGFMPKQAERPKGEAITTLTEIDLWEVSLVTFPANTAARVSGAKASKEISRLADWKSFERHLREEGGYSQDNATAMVAIAKRLADGEREAREAKAAVADSAERALAIFNI